MLLTFADGCGIIIKLSRETPSQRRQRTLKIVSVAKGEAGTLLSLLKKFGRKRQLPEKNFFKKLQKST